MNITRVERDGVEFFTIDETGESGMSESGLALLCGVSHQAVNKVLRNLLATWDTDNSLEPQHRKGVRLQPSKEFKNPRGQNADISLIRAEGCAKVIEYYAFESKYKTEEAVFAYRKFATKGITAWIQEITHWHGNPQPKNGIVIDFNTIDTLLTSNLDAASHRLYIYISKALRLRRTPNSEEIITGANLSKSNYSSAVGKLQDLNLLPSWCRIQRRQQPEKAVRDRLQAQLGGKAEALTQWGLIDLLTDTELIEVKLLNYWKEAIGHLLTKSQDYPNHQKRLHLYGPSDDNLDRIQNFCQDFNIIVTFELIAKPQLSKVS